MVEVKGCALNHPRSARLGAAIVRRPLRSDEQSELSVSEKVVDATGIEPVTPSV